MSRLTINFISNFANYHKASVGKEKKKTFIFPATGPNLGSYTEFFSYCVCYLLSFNPEQFLSLSLSFRTLTFLKSTGQLFCRMSCDKDSSVDPSLCILGWNVTEVMLFPSQCIMLGGPCCLFATLVAMFVLIIG